MTGDGQLTAILLLETMAETGSSASALRSMLHPWVQRMENLPVSGAQKHRLLGRSSVLQAAERAREELDGGRIVMSAGFDLDRVWLEVTDNGIGIPPEDRERIFERFYRVDKARSRESGGTGLGLSIARELVLRHNGSLALAPHEGPGTTVRLVLPIAGPPAS